MFSPTHAFAFTFATWRFGFNNMQVFICIAFNIMLERLPVSAASLAHALERCARW